MSKQCKIVEDLLPLYHDGVCSEESRQMVDEHLAQCEDCRKMLGQIDGELVSPIVKDADIKPLKSINKAVKKGKKKALIAGISIALAVMIVLFAGASIWWYAQEYTYYAAFAEGKTPDSVYEYNEDGSIKQAVVVDADKYTWYDGTYRYEVTVPSFLDSGYVSMTRLDNNEAEQSDLVICRGEGNKYLFHVGFTGTEHFWYDTDGLIHSPYFMVDTALNLYFPDHWTEDTRQEMTAKFEEYKDEVRVLVYDAMAMWPFIK